MEKYLANIRQVASQITDKPQVVLVFGLLSLLILLVFTPTKSSFSSSVPKFVHNIINGELLINDKQSPAVITARLIEAVESDDLAYVAQTDKHGNLLSEKTYLVETTPFVIPAPNNKNTKAFQEILERESENTFREYQIPFTNSDGETNFIRVGYQAQSISWLPKIPLLNGILVLIMSTLLLTLFYSVKKALAINKTLTNEILALENSLPSTEELKATDSFEILKHSKQYIKELKGTHQSLNSMVKIMNYKRSRMESVLKAIPFGAVLLDESGTTSFANEKINSLLGVSNEEVIGKKPSAWCQNSNVLAYLAKFEGQINQKIYESSVEFTPDDAPEKTVSMSAYPLFSIKNKKDIFGTMVILRDITQEQLAQSNRADFVAHMSHELKTPLNVLSMYSEALFGEEGKEESFRVEASNVIHDEIERMSTLINNLLSITKIEMGNLTISRQRVKLRDLLEDAFTTISRNASNAKLHFNLNLPNDFSPVCADKDLLRIAINNLLTNAIKYNRPNGTVEMTAEEAEDTILIKIKDTGIGIAEEDQHNVFEKFYRSDNQEVRDITGHGLGLALSKQIIDLHHGALTMESNFGSGTEFTIALRTESVLLKEVV